MSAMRVMQQIIRQIFYLSCLCIVIFVFILHESNTKNNKIDDGNDDKFAKKKNKKFIIFIILFGSLTIGIGIGICVYRLINFISDRQDRRIAPRDNELVFVVRQDDMIIEELANNAPVRPILDQDERIHERADNVSDNEPAVLDQGKEIYFDLPDIKFIDDDEEIDEDEPSINNGGRRRGCRN